MLWRSNKIHTMRRKTLWRNLGRIDSSALASNWPRRDNSDVKHKFFEVGRYEPSRQGENRVPTLSSAHGHTNDSRSMWGSSLWIAARFGRRLTPILKGVHLVLLTATLVLASPRGNRVVTGDSKLRLADWNAEGVRLGVELVLPDHPCEFSTSTPPPPTPPSP